MRFSRLSQEYQRIITPFYYVNYQIAKGVRTDRHAEPSSAPEAAHYRRIRAVGRKIRFHTQHKGRP